MHLTVLELTMAIQFLWASLSYASSHPVILLAMLLPRLIARLPKFSNIHVCHGLVIALVSHLSSHSL